MTFLTGKMSKVKKVRRCVDKCVRESVRAGGLSVTDKGSEGASHGTISGKHESFLRLHE